MATPVRPLVLPDTFCGGNESNWTDWKCHFDNVASVNAWSEEDKLKWLKVRLTGRAQTAFQHLSDDNQASYARATASLKERFEPMTRKHRYQAELQTRKKHKGESWADFAEDLKSIADKAYPDLEEKARERLALNSYLSQLDHPQVAFGVKQSNPVNLDAAVSTTLELEAYATPKTTPLPVLGVGEDGHPKEEDITTVGAINHSDKLADVLRGLSQRLDRLEVSQGARSREREQTADLPTNRGNSFQYGSGRGRYFRGRDITCYACGRSGHIARYCQSYQQQPFYPPQQPYQQPPQPQQPPPRQPQQPQPSPRQQQGNGRPPV